MPRSANPNNFHIQNAYGLSEADYLDYIIRAGHVSGSFLDAFQAAREFARRGGLYGIFRAFKFEPLTSMAPDLRDINSVWDHVRKTYDENGDDRRVLMNVWCEKTMDEAKYRLAIEMIKRSTKESRPIGFVFRNAASASLRADYDKEGNHYLTTPGAMDYLAAMHEHREVRLESGAYAFLDGDHSYTTGHPTFFANAGEYKENPQAWRDPRWQTGEWFIDWSKNQYHLGRDYQQIRRALGFTWDVETRSWQHSNANPILPPRKGITEALIDNMSKAEFLKYNPNWIPTPPWNEPWGYMSQVNWWRDQYGDLYEDDGPIKGGPGRVLSMMAEWTWEFVYAPEDDQFVFQQIYTLGNTGYEHDKKTGEFIPGTGWEVHNIAGPKHGGKMDVSFETHNLRTRFDLPDNLFGPVPTTPPPDPDPQPEPEPEPPVGVIDLAPYLLGDGRAYILSSDSSTEVVQTQYLDATKRHGFQVKNRNWEEIRFDDTYIWRGTDTSPNEQEYYELWENGQRGSRWCPRFWKIGQPFKRSPEVRFKSKATGQPTKAPYPDVTYLEMTAYHASYTFPNNITLKDVIEMVWYYTSASKPVERYFYAKHYGLVAWGSEATGFKTRISSSTLVSTVPQRGSWPGIQLMVALPVEEPSNLPDADDPRWQLHIATVGANGTNIRTLPIVRADTLLATIAAPGAKVWHILPEDLTATEKAFLKPADKEWHFIKLEDGRVGVVRSDMITLYKATNPTLISDIYKEWLESLSQHQAETQSLLDRVVTLSAGLTTMMGQVNLVMAGVMTLNEAQLARMEQLKTQIHDMED